MATDFLHKRSIPITTRKEITVPRLYGYHETPPAFLGNTVVEISVPSGKLIASDDLRKAPAFDIDPPMSINYGYGTDILAQLYAAAANVAYASVGNTCPKVIRRADGTIQVVTGNTEDGETKLGTICTDHWAAMLTDYQHWLDNGGEEVAEANKPYAVESYFVFDVTPGKYRWTVYSHSDEFDRDASGRITFAQLELIEAY